MLLEPSHIFFSLNLSTLFSKQLFGVSSLLSGCPPIIISVTALFFFYLLYDLFCPPLSFVKFPSSEKSFPLYRLKNQAESSAASYSKHYSFWHFL